jgi:hypothetical protein
MRSLLDVNVLLALFDSDHVDHQRSRRWFEREIRHGWASCAITENGFVRILSQPTYPRRISPAEAIERLAEATSVSPHERWSCEVSILSATEIDRTRIHGARQVTDAYLLALAVSRGGRFVTLDQRVPLSAVVGAEAANLVVI